MKIRIRYNTDREKIDPTLLPWRVLLDGQEFLASEVLVEVPTSTTCDEIAPGILKWHISCNGRATWQGQKCIIKAE